MLTPTVRETSPCPVPSQRDLVRASLLAVPVRHAKTSPPQHRPTLFR